MNLRKAAFLPRCAFNGRECVRSARRSAGDGGGLPDAAVHYEDCGVAHALAFGVLGGVFGWGVVDVDGADVAGGADGDEAAAADVDVLDGAAVCLVGVVELAERGLERAAVEDLALEGGVIASAAASPLR